MGIAFSGGIRTPEGFSGDNRTSQAFSGKIGTPAAFSGDNRTPHGLSGKIGTLRGPKLARSRPKPLRCPNAARERIGCPNAARQPPRVHALPGNTIGTGAELSQEETRHKCSCQFWEHLFRASANTQASTQQNPRIARGHHALTGARSNRYSHYWNERNSGVGGARGLPPPRSTYWNLFVENENVIAKPSPSTESAKIPTPILSHNRLTR